MRAPKVRAPHLGENRPVPASRAVGGDIRLVVIGDMRQRVAAIAAGAVGVIALGALVVGLRVIA